MMKFNVYKRVDGKLVKTHSDVTREQANAVREMRAMTMTSDVVIVPVHGMTEFVAH